MAKVRILPDHVANQIAAGEVIERPVAVVKELVENAVDAGATRIEVEFRHGGRTLMRIEDNGSGMSRDDALLALERHATSKITAAADLDRLASYGFRGEALPSIASISRFELQTREAGGDVGTEVVVNAGKLVHVRECGRPTGTRIEVTQLFNSVPARRKFLKTDTTEAAHIVTCVRLYALACPQVAFTLIEDGRVIFRSPASPSLAGRVADIFGRQIAEGLLEIEAVEPGLRISGLIGRPGQGRPSRHELITFVNQRPVDSRTLNYAVIESYAESLPRGRYPVAFLFLELDPAAVDVNVHPAKREVRFRSEGQVRSFVIRAVLECLRSTRPTGWESEATTNAAVAPGAEQSEASVMAAAPASSAGGTRAVASASARAPAVARSHVSHPSQATSPSSPPKLNLRPEILAPALRQTDDDGPSSDASGTPAPAMPVTGGDVPPASRWVAPAPVRPAPGMGLPRRGAAGWRFVGFTHDIYGLFETPDGLVMLDHRAAAERVWYERLEASWGSGPAESQRLLLPVAVEMDPVASALLTDQLVFLAHHGFEVVEFGRNFFRIEGVPACLEPADAESFLREVVTALRDGALAPREPGLARATLARLAASRAARSQPARNAVDVTSLLRQLFQCRQPHTTPSGRPTYIELGHGELARRFHRSS